LQQRDEITGLTENHGVGGSIPPLGTIPPIEYQAVASGSPMRLLLQKIAASAALTNFSRAHRDQFAAIATVALAFIAFAAFRAVQTTYIQHAETTASAFFVFAGLIGGISAATPAAAASRGIRILCTGLALICGLYSLFYYPGFGIVDESAYQAAKPLLTLGRWIAVGAAIAAWWRPTLAAIPCAYLIAAKAAVHNITQIRTGFLDYAPLAEIGLFLSFGLIAARFIRGPTRDETSMMFLLLCGIAIHFSNYFWSGWLKLRVGDNPLQWVWTNPTFNLALAGHNLGTLPLGSYTLIPLSWSFLPVVIVALNAVTFATQLASVIAITRLRWIIALTIIFDLMHIGIFLLCGINFWTWILFNIAIGVAVTAISATAPLPFVLRLIPCGIVILAPQLFNIATLGWYDSRSIRDMYFVAMTESGASYRVPFNYFLGNSYAFYHGSWIGRPHGKHFRTSVWGVTVSSDARDAGRNCTREANYPENDDPVTIERLTKYIRAHHSYIVGHVDAQGRYPYDLFPHHHFTNPVYFREFQALDKRTIVRYDLVTESSCLSYDGANLTKTIKHRSVTNIDVK